VTDAAHTFWPRWYRALARARPAIEVTWRRVGLGNVVRVVVRGRRTGKPRSVLLGLLRVGNSRYLGHPDVGCSWTANLDAAGGGELELRDGRRLAFSAALLDKGPERDAVIRATFRQHPFPGSLLYWIFRGHLREAGRIYRITPVSGGRRLD
jgi:hypothetical protein